jgi:hypothetical protein
MPNIIGTGGNDTITPDSVTGGVTGGFPGDGDDSILGLGGDDFIIGGGGDDTIVADGSGAGYDRVSYDGALGGVTVNLGARSSSGAAGNDILVNVDVVYGSGHNDLLLTGVIDRVELLAGENGHDTLSAADGISAPGSLFQLRGGIGNDCLLGNSGTQHIELLYGDDGDDTIAAGASSLFGSNEWDGGNGNDSILGGSGANQGLRGGDNDDILRAGSGAGQILYGNAGNDLLIGGSGTNQRLDGGEGDDVIQGGAGAGQMLYGNAGNDC